MAVYAVTYDYDERDAVRDAVRPDHRAFLRLLNERGVLLASGPLTDGETPGAMLIVRAEDADSALAALEPDPFWQAGLVAGRRARGWDPVIGPWA